MATARARGIHRREELLDAALRCFEEQGLLRTGIEDVRKAAGASPSSMYHLFKDFPALVAALLERTFERRFSQVTAHVVTTRTARSAVRALVEAHLGWVFEHEAEARFMYQALALELDGGHREALRDTKARLLEALVAHLIRLEVLPGPHASMLVDVVLLAPTHQACRSYLSVPGSVEPKWMRSTLPKLAWQSARCLSPRLQAEASSED